MTYQAKRSQFETEALSHVAELYAAALRYCRNEGDAQDLVQETLLRAFAAWDQFQPGTNCRAWLFRILTNNFINEYRRSARERSSTGKDDAIISQTRRKAALDPEGDLAERTIGDEVLAALSGLPEEFRRVVVMADLLGQSYREIASKLRCPIGTVMSRLFRARRVLETVLSDYARENGILRTPAPAAAAA